MKDYICKNLINYRKANRLTLQEMGALTGIPYGSFYSWEKGSLPSLAKVSKLCESLGLNVQEFMFTEMEFPSVGVKLVKGEDSWALVGSKEEITSVIDFFHAHAKLPGVTEHVLAVSQRLLKEAHDV